MGASAAVLAIGLGACGGGDAAGDGPATTGGSLAPTAESSACEGEPAAGRPDGFDIHLDLGDVRIIHDGDYDMQEMSSSTGDIVPLFELEETERVYYRGVTADERDIFAVTSAGIRRFDRSTRELSMFATDPDPSEDPGLPDNPWLNGGIAISDTHVFATVVNLGGFDYATSLYDQAAIVIFDRATTESRVVAFSMPVEGTIRLRAHGNHFFHLRSVDVNFEPGTYQYRDEVYSYDVESGAGRPLVETGFNAGGFQFQDNFLFASHADEDNDISIVRIPFAGGPPQVVFDGVSARDFQIAGDKLYFVASVRGEGQVSRNQLSVVDLAGGEGQPFGGVGCRAVPVHSSDDYLYADDPVSGKRIRFAL